MKFRYKQQLLIAFDEIIKENGMVYADIDEDFALLINQKYALWFCEHYGEVNMEYIHIAGEKELKSLALWNYCISHCVAEDREGLTLSEEVQVAVPEGFTLLARSLIRHLPHILVGDTKWFEDYMKFELADEFRPVRENIKQIILGKQKYLKFRARILGK